MNTELERITIEIIQQNFNMELPEADRNNFIHFRELLIEEISFLLNHNFEKLLGILYRIDVDEQLVKTTLADNSGKPAAEIISDLIIQRQMQKAVTRIKYRKGEI